MLRSLVGSEMCIRDRYQRRVREFPGGQKMGNIPGGQKMDSGQKMGNTNTVCRREHVITQLATKLRQRGESLHRLAPSECPTGEWDAHLSLLNRFAVERTVECKLVIGLLDAESRRKLACTDMCMWCAVEISRSGGWCRVSTRLMVTVEQESMLVHEILNGEWRQRRVVKPVSAHNPPSLMSWLRGPGPSTPRVPFGGFSMACVGDKMYVVGGSLPDQTKQKDNFYFTPVVKSNTVLLFNLGDSSWSTTTDMNHPRSGASCVAEADKLYVCGGDQPPQTMEVFCTQTSQWSSPETLPRDRTTHTAISSGGKLYLLGGVETERYVAVSVGGE
eukprot:TRINITY_DN6321_c0_g1_i1.p1 TRINITY_DN6321_c0_g1~~TRINITY_DN6321_c0_g1_i1.p1  ORF type:complete len:384 (+),score=54.20 TRINITY_DN6321_c0_g1_i1:161-1153(+)